MTVGPLRPGTSTGTISAANLPASIAATALRCDCSANVSCALRETPRLARGVFGMPAHVHIAERAPQPVANHPVDECLVAKLVAVARAVEVVRRVGHGLLAARDERARASPARIDCAASMTALRPEPQTLLMVTADTVAGTPALIAAWRAGACPTPPWTTLPMMTSCRSPASIPARSTAARMATAPSSGADSGDSPPRKRPMGVRAAETMTAVRSSDAVSARTSPRARTTNCVACDDSRLSGGAAAAAATWRAAPASRVSDRGVDLVAQTRRTNCSTGIGHRMLLLARAADGDRHGAVGRLALPDHRQIRHLHERRLADPIVERLGRARRAGRARPPPRSRSHTADGGTGHVVDDGNDADLLRGQPERERPGVVLDEPADEPLHRSERARGAA